MAHACGELKLLFKGGGGYRRCMEFIYGLRGMADHPETGEIRSGARSTRRCPSDARWGEIGDLIQMGAIARFNGQLIGCPLFCGTRRPRRPLGLKAPVKAAADKLYPGDGEKRNMWWAGTFSIFDLRFLL